MSELQFHIHHGRVMNCRHDRSKFSQIIGEHAVRMYELAKADRSSNKKGLMSTWAHVSKLNDEWSGLVTLDEHPDSEFCSITSNLVSLYSEALGDFVIDRSVPKKMDEIVRKESDFYSALAKKNNQHEEMRKQWVNYTKSVLNMIYHMDRTGPGSESFYSAAADCIQSGVLLGNWLDHSLFG